MNHDGVLKTLHGHDVFGSDTLLHQFHQLSARLTGCFGKLRRRRRHQGGARQHQAQGFGHDLHGGGGSHKGTGSAAWAGVVFVVFELLGGDHTCFFPGVVLADLFQCQQLIDRTGRILRHILLRQHVRFHDAAGHDDGTHLFEPSDAHQHGGHGLVAAGNEHAAVKAGGIGLRLHQIDDRVPVRQRIVDSVMSLGDPVAHVGRKIARGFAAALIDTLHSLLDKAVQMRGTRVAVAEGALHHDLGLVQVFDPPAHSHPERIHLRSKFSYFLTFQHTLLNEIAAVTGDNRSVDIVGCMGAEEDRQPLHIIGPAPAMRRNTIGDFFVTGIVGICQRGVHFGIHISGSNAIDVDALAGELVCHALAELCDAAL